MFVTTLPCSTLIFNSSTFSVEHKCAGTFPVATSLHVKHEFRMLTNTEFKHVTSTYFRSLFLVFVFTFNVVYSHRVIDI